MIEIGTTKKFGIVDPLHKWTRDEVLALVVEAREIGKKAANDKLIEISKGGPLSKYYPEVNAICAIPYDIAGYGWVVIDTDQSFYRVASKITKEDEPGRRGRTFRFTCDRNHGGGGAFSIFDMSNRQEMSVNIAAEEAVQGVLKSHGIKVKYVYSWVD